MGTGCTPVVPVNSSTPALASPVLFKRAEGGRARWEEKKKRTESAELEVQGKHSVPFSAWPAPRYMTEAHLKYCHDA